MGWAIVVTQVDDHLGTNEIHGVASGAILDTHFAHFPLARSGSDVAEAFAVHQALKWAQFLPITAEILYDSKVAGCAAAGQFGFSEGIASLSRASRGIIQCMDGRAPTPIFIHVKAHSGIPLNEFADDIAKLAALGKAATGQLAFLPAEWYDPAHSVAEWAWLVHRSPAEKVAFGLPPLPGNLLQLPTPPAPSVEHLATLLPDPPAQSQSIQRTLSLALLSVNVGGVANFTTVPDVREQPTKAPLLA